VAAHRQNTPSTAAAKKKAAAEWLDRHNAEQVAAADAALANGRKSGHAK